MFVVERFVPGLSRAALVAALGELERTIARFRSAGRDITYLGSTIVPSDEACYCRFKATDAETIADANRAAGVPFDRIVPALHLERSTHPRPRRMRR